MKKIIAIVCIISSMLLASVAVVPGENIRLTSDSSSILYVGGSGPGNYTRIQDAIDNASDGDTVFVYTGTYYEYIVIDKTINLIGEKKETTVIKYDDNRDVINITKNGVNIQGFTIRNNHWGNGIKIYYSSNVTISNCNTSNNILGIYLYYSSNNTISNCNISNNQDGIWLDHSSNNTISNCNTSNNTFGIWLDHSSNNTISNCNISNNQDGIDREGIPLAESSNNTISNCSFENDGIVIYGDELSYFIHNIHDNTVNGNPLLYYKNEDNIVLDGIKAGQIIIVNCNNFDIKNMNINNTDVGIEIAYSKVINILDCNISNNKYGILLEYSSNNTISNCNTSNNGESTILFHSSNNTISNCNTSKNLYGILLGYSSNNTISNCNISNNKYGGIDLTYSSNNRIHYSNIYNNSRYGIKNHNSKAQYTINASYNYWGSSDGPGRAGPGSGDNISQNVIYQPWLTEPWEGKGTDSISPFIKITKPEKGFYLFNNLIIKYSRFKPLIIGRIEIKVDTTDNESGIKRVEFYIDNELKYNDTEYPYSYEWKKDKILGSRQHTHTIKVVAYDNYGNSNYDEITVRKYL